MVPLRKVVEKDQWKVAAVLLCYSVCVLLVAHFSAFGSDAVSSWHRAGAKPDLVGYPSRAWKIWIVGLPAAWLIYRVILSRVYTNVHTSPPNAWAMDWSAMAVFAATNRPTILADWCFNV